MYAQTNSDVYDYDALFARHVQKLSTHGDEVRGCCPFHKDNKPSWSGNRTTGRWRCFGCNASGNAEQFATRLGEHVTKPQKAIRPGDLRRESRVVAQYDYTDETGKLLFQVVRFEPKNFLQRRPDGNGGWIWNLDGVKRVLYRLSEVPQAVTIYLPEGEKDTDQLRSLGLPATCNSGGAGKWQPEYSAALAGKHVVIIPDNDETGERHALQVARALLPVAASVKIVRLPGLPPLREKHGEDVSDWLDAGHSKEELLTIVEATSQLCTEDVHAEQKRNHVVLTRMSDVKSENVTWLWRGRIPLGKITILDGDPGLGKSLISIDIAARTSPVRLMPDRTKGDLLESKGVVLLSAEDDPADTIKPRLEAAGADMSHIVLLSAVREEESERLPTLLDLDAIREAIKAVNAKLVVIDPLMAYLPGKVDSHRDQDVRSVLALLAKLAAETGVAVLILRHLNKTEGKNALYRGGGSIGIIGAARSGLVVAKDPENEERRILAVTKSNLAKLAPALSYTIEAVNEVPRVVWGTVTTHTASTLLAQQTDSNEDRSALDEAKTFLREILRDGAHEAKVIHKEARSAGISEATLRRAKTSLRVLVDKEGNFLSTAQRWMWSLPVTEDAQDPPEDPQTPSEDAQIREHEHLQANIEKNTRNDADFAEGAQDSMYEHLQSANEHLQSYEEDL